MERKIGEIFEFKKDWYQCVEGRCKDCHFSEKRFICKQFITKDFCTHDIIFKKLERVGEPITVKDRTFQCLNAFKTECTGCVFLNSKRGCDKRHYIDGPCFDREIWVEIKPTKKDMEEKKPTYEELLHYYHSTVGLWAIDRSPQEVSLDWICDNAFQLGIDYLDVEDFIKAMKNGETSIQM